MKTGKLPIIRPLGTAAMLAGRPSWCLPSGASLAEFALQSGFLASRWCSDPAEPPAARRPIRLGIPGSAVATRPE